MRQFQTASFSSQSSDPPSTSNIKHVCVRILCLHGKGGDGNQFVNHALMPLRTLVEKRTANNLGHGVSFQWEAITAPYEIIPGDGGAGYSWWTMPPGVRSYNAQEYEGFEKSASMVIEKAFPPEQKNSTDIIFGHSQGAILTAALLSINEKLWDQTSHSRPLGYILNGVAWPNPYQDSLKTLKQQCTISNDGNLLPRMLFIMGKRDNINPIESAMKVHDAFQAADFDVSIANHDGGHSVPLGRDEDSSRALEDVADWIIDIAKQKALRLENEA